MKDLKKGNKNKTKPEKKLQRKMEFLIHSVQHYVCTIFEAKFSLVHYPSYSIIYAEPSGEHEHYCADATDAAKATTEK